MQIESIMCPYCYKFFAHNGKKMDDKGREKTEFGKSKTYGCSKIMCEKCGRDFILKDITEMAIVDESQTRPRRLSIADIIVFLVGLLIILGGYSIDVQNNTYEPLAIILYIIAGIILLRTIIRIIISMVSYSERVQRWKEESEASQDRLKDFQYAWSLKRNGFDVPEKYLK